MAEVSIYQKKKKKSDEEEFDKDAWMVTFGDLLQLLITFFVLLISMSSMDQKIVTEMFSVFTGGLGVLGFTEETSIIPPNIRPIISPPNVDIESFKRFLAVESGDFQAKTDKPKNASNLVDSLLVDGVNIEKRGDDFVMTLSNEALFEKATARLSHKLLPTLDRISSILALSKNEIIIEGHTDNIPIKSPLYVTNWELSAARAGAVYRYLLARGEVAPERMRAKGRSFYHPRASNISERYRQRNRRVEILIKQFRKESF